MNDLHAELERNELLFIQQHRSAVFPCGHGTLFVSSDPRRPTWNFLGSLRESTAGLGEALGRTRALFAAWGRTPCIKLTPMSEPAGWEEALREDGWSPSVRLTHMIQTAAPVPPGDHVRVRACTTPDDLLAFSDVQSRGFGTPEWKQWAHMMNVVNHCRDDQAFFLAEMDGVPCGVCLLLSSGQVAGLYAVATLDTHRGQGVARALIHAASSHARQLGCHALCLNTAAGGAAEQVFRKMGFENVFDSVFYTAPSV